jgi:hypothetical protein
MWDILSGYIHLNRGVVGYFFDSDAHYHRNRNQKAETANHGTTPILRNSSSIMGIGTKRDPRENKEIQKNNNNNRNNKNENKNKNKKTTYLHDIEHLEAANYSCDVSVHCSLSQDSRVDDVVVSDLVGKESMRWELHPEAKQAMCVKRSIGKFATGREWSLQKKGTVSAYRFRVEETHGGSKA